MEVGSPEWWLNRLVGKLIERRPNVDRLAAYYDGVHDLRFASKKFKQHFGGLFSAFADNWCALVVDSPEERLKVEGFRISPDTEEADADAWRIWQRNSMDSQAALTHVDAILTGESYVSTWFDADGHAEIFSESARNVIVEHDPRSIHKRRAALRLWEDDWGYTRAEVFLPEGVFLFRRKGPIDSDALNYGALAWEVDESAAEGGFMQNPLRKVPIVPFANRPRVTATDALGITVQSEISQVIPIQDAVNKLIADLLVAAETGAYPQKWSTGMSLDMDPVTKKVVEPNFSPDQKVWISEEPETRFGQFSAAALENYVKGIDMLVQHIASITHTPPHYLNASADRLSGESIKAAETGLVAKCRRKMTTFGEGWEEVMRLAGSIEGNPTLSAAIDAETIWRDPESRTESVHVDSVLKQKALGIPDPILWEELGYSPSQITRMKAAQVEQSLLAIPPAPPRNTEPPAVNDGTNT